MINHQFLTLIYLQKSNQIIDILMIFDKLEK